MGIIKHTQHFLHDPDNGVYGDCWRATVACLLRLPVDAVPHVCNGPDDGKASERMRAYLDSQNCALIQVPFSGEMSLEQILEYVGSVSVAGGLHWCLMGTSRTGCNHVVICKGSEIVHDPSITQSGIVAPSSDGLWWVEWVVQRPACDAVANPSPATNVRGVEQVDYPKILYVCETCWEGNSEACGSDRDRINVTPDGHWLCEDCRDGENIDAALCREAPKLYTEPLAHLRTACEGIADDYMTSEHHHPGYVLIPTAKFEEIRAAIATTEGSGDAN